MVAQPKSIASRRYHARTWISLVAPWAMYSATTATPGVDTDVSGCSVLAIGSMMTAGGSSAGWVADGVAIGAVGRTAGDVTQGV